MTMKPIKSKASIAWIREANQAKVNAIDRLSDVPGDTIDNSIDRLRLLIEETWSVTEPSSPPIATSNPPTTMLRTILFALALAALIGFALWAFTTGPDLLTIIDRY